ncbi:pleckstrin homology domain-containing family G member 7-like [Sycon ciliatum]|uniref:pleckstrin homology domain-containing family G member 7-like n=1 Tax=Sycon ciliatum TaxID=27933 RepID=UPI0031F6E567
MLMTCRFFHHWVPNDPAPAPQSTAGEQRDRRHSSVDGPLRSSIRAERRGPYRQSVGALPENAHFPTTSRSGSPEESSGVFFDAGSDSGSYSSKSSSNIHADAPNSTSGSSLQRGDAHLSNPGGAGSAQWRSSSLKVRRTSNEDAPVSDQLKLPQPPALTESPRASPSVSKKFHFFTLTRPRKRTESSSDDLTSSGRLCDAINEIFLPTICKHQLKYLTDSSLHWFHVAACYDTSPIIGEGYCTPFSPTDQFQHRHNKPQELMEESCAKHSACNPNSYCSSAEWRFQLSVWELLRSEVVYLIEALLVLQDVHHTVLQKLQRRGHLCDVDHSRVFGNVLELAVLSEKFCGDLLSLFTSHKPGQSASLESLISILNRFVVRFHAPYQQYGANYHQSMPYVDKLLQRKDFQEYATFCHQHQRVRKRSLKSFLFEPVQRLQRLPMLLKNIVQDYHGNRSLPLFSELSSAAKAIEVSCHELDGLVKQYLQEQKCHELQSSIQWPTVFAVDPAGALPDNTEKLLSLAPLPLHSSTRWLAHHGSLKLLEYVGTGITTRLASVVAFLFNDFLLLTRHRPVVSGHKANRFESPLETGSNKNLSSGSPLLGPAHSNTGLMEYYVCKQPYPVSHVEVLDVPTDRNLRHTFCILLKNDYHQYVGAVSLEAPSEKSKTEWMQSIERIRRQCA